jgi:hypothetical protein
MIKSHNTAGDAQFAKPRAGTALARASRDCLQAATEQGEVQSYM